MQHELNGLLGLFRLEVNGLVGFIAEVTAELPDQGFQHGFPLGVAVAQAGLGDVAGFVTDGQGLGKLNQLFPGGGAVVLYPTGRQFHAQILQLGHVHIKGRRLNVDLIGNRVVLAVDQLVGGSTLVKQVLHLFGGVDVLRNLLNLTGVGKLTHRGIGEDYVCFRTGAKGLRDLLGEVREILDLDVNFGVSFLETLDGGFKVSLPGNGVLGPERDCGFLAARALGGASGQDAQQHDSGEQ